MAAVIICNLIKIWIWILVATSVKLIQYQQGVSATLYRRYAAKVSIPSSWRLVFNAEYDLGKNQKITFAFGKNFDGSTKKSGNLVSILNFITGIGTGRRI